jgi:hypothetical protein
MALSQRQSDLCRISDRPTVLESTHDSQGEGDAHVFGEMKVAWFNDPDGNILSIGDYAA